MEGGSSNNKRKSIGGKSPRGFLVEKKPRVDHRHYGKIKMAKENAAPNMNFGLQVAARVLQVTNNNSDNKICSPLSITAVLNILAAGATGGMLDQLLGALECADVAEVNASALRLTELLKGSDDEDAPDIAFANALWVDQRLRMKQQFQQVLRDVHKAEPRVADFENKGDEVVQEANLWVEEQTKGLIKQILSKDCISKDMSMILANALYFKGVWVETFKPENTEKKDFYLLNGDKVQARFMMKSCYHFDYGSFEQCKVLRMMYREGEDIEKGETPRSFSMYIFLPDDRDGLPNLLENIKIDGNMFEKQIKLKYEKIDNLCIPKFSFECDFSLTEPMKELGLTLPFDETCRELSEMVEYSNGSDWPYVSEVLQKCRIEVNEKGTKAAAFTRVGLFTGAGRRRTPPPPINFVADHPFMFTIREDFSGAILFIGTVLNPCPPEA